MPTVQTDYKAQQEILRMETQASFPFLIEITRPTGFDSDGNETYEILRYCNSDSDIEYEGETYSASYFKLTPPEKTSTGIKDATITISALDGEWIEKIRNTQDCSAIRFIAMIMYENDGTTEIVPIDEMRMKLTNASWTDSAIQWTMKFDDLMNIQMPCVTLDSNVCPALV